MFLQRRGRFIIYPEFSVNIKPSNRLSSKEFSMRRRFLWESACALLRLSLPLAAFPESVRAVSWWTGTAEPNADKGILRAKEEALDEQR